MVETLDAATTLSLVQSLHRQLRLRELLELFERQAATLIPVTGLRYVSPAGPILFAQTPSSEHYVKFRVEWHNNESLGELYFYFDEPQANHRLQQAEDLVAVLASPLHNALMYEEALEQQALPTPAVETLPSAGLHAIAEPQQAPARCDTLLLISLDSYQQLITTNGSAWAQAVLQSVQDQVRTGLREADGVFQIDDGLLALLLPRTGQHAANAVADKVRDLIAGLQLHSSLNARALTACMGVAISRDADSAETVMQRAEEALEVARRQGPGGLHIHA